MALESISWNIDADGFGVLSFSPEDDLLGKPAGYCVGFSLGPYGSSPEPLGFSDLRPAAGWQQTLREFCASTLLPWRDPEWHVFADMM